MQTILRLGSIAETKVGNGGRISVSSVGGQSLQSGGSGMSSARPGGGGNPHGNQDPSRQSQKISICSIASIPERDLEDEEGVETSFISVPTSALPKGFPKAKDRHVRISTGSSPDSESFLLKSRLDTLDSVGDADLETSETSPFCSP